jgi:hypothetical protein
MKGDRNNEIDVNGGHNLMTKFMSFQQRYLKLIERNRNSRIYIESVNLVAGSPHKQRKGVKLSSPFYTINSN